MSSKETNSKFIIQSSIDNQMFTVNSKFINSSALLKNICDITDVSDGSPIFVSCSGDSLKLYIKIIQNYQSIVDKRDIEFEKALFDSFTFNKKDKLIKLVQNLCILDSDFFLDSVSDYILGILEKMDWMDIQKYLEFENDFSEKERHFMFNDEKLEYFLSLDTKNFKFPFEAKSLYSLKTDFSTPLNILIARIVQRSNEKTSYQLSLINKTLKTEVDRYPFKLSKFDASARSFTLNTYSDEFKNGFNFFLKCENYDKKYFNILKKRKVIAAKSVIEFDKFEEFFQLDSGDFIISKHNEIYFGDTINSIYRFDAKRCPAPSVFYTFGSVEERKVNFQDIHSHLIANNLLKKVRIGIFDIFNFFEPKSRLWIHKNSNASKFHTLKILNFCDIHLEFITFANDYMEQDGILETYEAISGIPFEEIISVKSNGTFKYPISLLLKYSNNIIKN